LAEAVARQRLNERQMTEPVSAEQFFQLKQKLNSLPDSGPNVRWAKWFMADPSQRNISPASTISLSSYLDGLLRTGNRAALRQAVYLDPANAMAHVRLAQSLVDADQTSTLRERDFAEANWHQDYARKLQPESKELAQLCDLVASRINALRTNPSSGPEDK
jgi:hypothetical protein